MIEECEYRGDRSSHPYFHPYNSRLTVGLDGPGNRVERAQRTCGHSPNGAK